MSGLRGKICSVSLTDFVTYDYVTFYPGVNLNVIIGPNGTGKSTLVAAIVLGMGGSPKVLSRALNIGDYVKNGKQTATITISIYRAANQHDTADVATFQRDIDLDGTSRYQLDGRRSTQTAYLRAVADLNIQVDNLCQFLPQDRVQDFAKMNARELLASTQASVCAPEVEQAWKSLCEMRTRQRQQGSTRAENLAKLADCERLNAALGPQIASMHRRSELLADYEVCTKKKAWMEFEELYMRHQEYTEDLRQAVAVVERIDGEMQPLREQIMQIDVDKAKFEGAIRKHSEAADRSNAAIGALTEKFGAVQAAMRKARDDFEFARSTNEERRQEMSKATDIQQVLIADMRDQKAAAGSAEERNTAVAGLTVSIDERRAAVQRLLARRHEIGEQLHESVRPQLVNAAARITAVESIGDRKLELLRTKYDHAYRGVLWLRENVALFRGRVYEPMVLELNVMDSRNAKYIEGCASTRDLIAFTCELKEDMELMHAKLRREQRLNVNLIHSPPAERCTYVAPRAIRELAQFGFHSYAIDLIEGPAPLLNALCKNNRLHAVPVGDDRTFEMAEQLPADVTLFFTTNHRFQVTRSKYSKETSTTCNEIQGMNLLNIGVDHAQLAKLKEMHAKLMRTSDALRNERTRIESELGELEAACNELQAERQAITAKAQALTACAEKLRRHVQKMERLPKPVDLNTEKSTMHDTLQRTWRDALRLQTKAPPLYTALCDARTESNVQRERYTKFLHANHAMHEQLKSRQEAAEKAARMVARIRELHDRNKRSCKEKQAAATALTDGKTPSDAAQFPYREAFDALPAVMDELRTHMDELQGEIDCLAGDGGQSVVAEFESRGAQIERLRESIASYESETGRLEQQMGELHAKWHPIVLGTVERINANFAQYMSAMRFAGEVALMPGADQRDYDEYGIEIRVKYRAAERLQTLDRNVQSGGERAVAIAVYSLSLQQMSHVPFRCVDEINQGMDATNERKIFNMLVEETALPGKSQYFFVTPKLLPNLAFNDGMTVHVVHNGKFVHDERSFERRWE